MSDDKKDDKKLITLRVDTQLYEAFKFACSNNDITASQALRAFMRDYVKKHGQTKLF